MRRVGLILIVIVVIAGAAYGGFTYGKQQGVMAGQATAASDSKAFFGTRGALPGDTGTGAGPGGGGGRGGQGSPGSGVVSPGAGGPSGGGGRNGGTPGAGGMAPGPGGRTGATPDAGATPGVGGSPGAGRGNGQNAVAGRVIGVTGQSLALQNSADNASVNVTTTTMTVFTKMVAATTADLKTNDVVVVQGEKMGDNAYAASMITTTNPQTQAGAANQGFPGAAGGPTAGGRNAAGASGTNAVVVGRVSSVSANTVFVTSLDGATITVTTTPMTKVEMTQPAALSDIKVGDSLVVVGDRSSDTVSARLVTDQGQG